MDRVHRVVKTFPTARLPTGGIPVEVSLIAQLGHGAGDHLFESVAARQRSHDSFVDELDEPSAQLGTTDFPLGDPTALYSFVVGPGGHPFHRHAGHRVFTAIAGSSGAQLRFCSASLQEIEADPEAFVRALRYVDIPGDCLFTVRFGGETWHQFAPLDDGGAHPAFFALSCHTNELGGALSETQRAAVLAGDASIPTLTDVLPAAVRTRLAAADFNAARIPTIALSLDAPRASLQDAMCSVARTRVGRLRGAWGRWRRASGYVSVADPRLEVESRTQPESVSLLFNQLNEARIDHEDCFVIRLPRRSLAAVTPAAVLAALLDGFLENPPRGVGRLMALRNVLVRPLGLRTSPLGCPVSSLLSPTGRSVFAGRFPVLDQQVDADRAQVVLGADDRHLRFRSCVSVHVDGDVIECTLATRVACRNLFGRVYLGLIDRVHRSYIAPAMLALAAHHVLERDSTRAPLSPCVAHATP